MNESKEKCMKERKKQRIKRTDSKYKQKQTERNN